MFVAHRWALMLTVLLKHHQRLWVTGCRPCAYKARQEMNAYHGSALPCLSNQTLLDVEASTWSQIAAFIARGFGDVKGKDILRLQVRSWRRWNRTVLWWEWKMFFFPLDSYFMKGHCEKRKTRSCDGCPHTTARLSKDLFEKKLGCFFSGMWKWWWALFLCFFNGVVSSPGVFFDWESSVVSVAYI